MQPTRDSSKLGVPRTAYPASIHSNNTFRRTTSGGASDRYLSRTNTGTTDPYIAATNAESQSIVTMDKIPSAKPSATYSDLLWTQIDVLDDVRNMASEVRNRGSFFNDKFNEELSKLKQSQNKLLETMSTQHFSDLDASEHQKQLYHLSRMAPVRQSSGNLLDEENIVHENEESKDAFEHKKRQQEKINVFFKEDDLELKNQTIYKKQNFDDVNQYVSEIKQDLQVLGESMKQFDESTREIW
ncbi:uncharacterized protein SPAPADRAFT_59653 [Spathaspora passalidarum NRRL Y-27907]|uniref:Uncharacterized protein n=1 Tax=Spathaspora passalidarum (strain NRRL Y-27907 / 11-Y1) TaxID=619300 RepID=G3AHQ9_SPAPN|nr:uncharacterized protein SPAPADRAFT_59653 [Spathaspora passalidarum NRRL Y-27907]EGW34223.1 hypothetical protein SPAPADRAFT_59653 [Spathaspora passalidarum NRRL Y-27907]